MVQSPDRHRQRELAPHPVCLTETETETVSGNEFRFRLNRTVPTLCALVGDCDVTLTLTR
jgi:hypothetical protein